MLDFVQAYLPILIVGAISGAFTIVFVLAYIALQKSVHLLTALHVVADFCDNPFLRSCQREG